MNSQAQRTVLLSVVFLCGCQSLDSLVPWQTRNTPKYTAEELAILDAPKTADGGRNSITPTSSTSKPDSSGIVQASYNSEGPAMPASAERLQQMVRAGQTIVASGDTDPIKLAEARNYFEQALTLDQRHSAAHHGMAIVADLQKDYQTAEFHYKQALSANPSDPNLLNDLGYSYVLQNRFAEATNYLTRVLQISPNFERAKVNMALMSLKRGNRQEAQQVLAGMYDPTKAQATLAKLEQSVQEMQTAQLQTAQLSPAAIPNNGQMQVPYTGGAMPQQNFQSQQNFPPEQSFTSQQPDAVAQDVLRRMQQERNQGNAVAGNSPPIHVYPPGILEELGAETAQNLPQDQNNGGNMPGQPWNSNQQQSVVQRNQQMMTPGPNGTQSGYPQQQFANPQFANQQFTNQPSMPPLTMPQHQPNYPQMSRQNMPGMNQNGNLTQQPNLQNRMPQAPPMNYANGQLQNQQPFQHYGQSAPRTAQSAPLAGLNAGPGALFPIGSPNGQAPQNPGQLPVSPSMNGTGYPPANSNSQPLYENGRGSFSSPPISQNNYPNQNGMPYGNTTSPVSSSRTLDGGFHPPMNSASAAYPFQNPDAQYQQPRNLQATPTYRNSAATNSNTQGMGASTQNSGSPLEAYERQLQNLDSQYNRAIQQMDGNSMGISTVPARY